MRAIARIRVQVSARFVMGVASCKNHDEPINYTVRVSVSFYFKIISTEVNFLSVLIVSVILKSLLFSSGLSETTRFSI